MEGEDREKATAKIEAILEILESTEISKRVLKFPIEHQFHFLKVEFRFLRTFLRSKLKWRNPNALISLILPFNAAQKNDIKKNTEVWVNSRLVLLDYYRREIINVCLTALENTQASNSVLEAGPMILFLDSLLESLIDLLTWKLSLDDSLKKEIKSHEEKLRFLKNFIASPTKESMHFEKLEYITRHVESVAGNIGCLSYLCWSDAIDENEMHLKLASLLEKLKPNNLYMREIYAAVLKALRSSQTGCPLMHELVKSFIISLFNDLKELKDLEPGLIDSVNDRTEILSRAQFLLTDFLGGPQEYTELEKFKNLWTLIDAMANEAGDFVHSFYVFENKEAMAREMELCSRKFSEKSKAILAELKFHVKDRNLAHFDFPRTDQLGYLDYLLEHLSEFLNCIPDSIAFMMHEIEKIQADLQYFLRTFPMEIANSDMENEELQNFRIQVANAAYEIEHLIDSLLVGDILVQDNMFCLLDIMLEIRVIKAEVADYNKSLDITIHSAANTHQSEVLDIKDVAQGIIDQLRSGSMQLEIISIVGMSGIGKTTLAKKVYNDPLVMDHFHIRAWCSNSQVRQKRDLLLDILGNIIELTDQICNMSDGELADRLYRCLKGRRYLLVMDDMWKCEAWYNLIKSFPNDANGSRILSTSQTHDVALGAGHNSSVYPLNLLSEEESWLILQKKLFNKDGCPPSLTKSLKQIAKNCKGLPLALFLIAGLLDKTDKKEEWWEQVAKESSSLLITANSEKEFMNIFELSYKHLPDHLKPCFLYFGLFPKGKEVFVKNLIWLWIAEGFVRSSELRSLEDVAEDYLMDLVGRNLIKVVKKRLIGGIKACQLNDQIHDFCVAKAEEEKFFQLLQGNGEYLFHSSDGSSSNKAPFVHRTYKFRRLCISSTISQFAKLRPSGPYVRSLLFSGSDERYQTELKDTAFISDKFKLLRVLDLGCISIGDSFPNEVNFLVHLRYLAIQGCMNFIPPSISSLSNLETFLVKGLTGEIVLPESIWDLPKLKHLHVEEYAAFSLDSYELKDSSQLLNLETFSSPSLSHGEDIEKVLRRLTRLRKLKCIFFESRNSSENCNRLPVLDFLTQLESLKVFYRGSPRYPCKFMFPSALKKLTLSKFGLPWREISTIAKLPNLEVLKLLFRAFEGPEWNVNDDEFLKLKFLKLENLNIAIWNVSSNHFPCLQQLVLQKCKELKEIPSGFGDIPSLQIIEVHWCSQSATKSIKQIQEKHHGLGQELEVLVHPPLFHF